VRDDGTCVSVWLACCCCCRPLPRYSDPTAGPPPQLHDRAHTGARYGSHQSGEVISRLSRPLSRTPKPKSRATATTVVSPQQGPGVLHLTRSYRSRPLSWRSAGALLRCSAGASAVQNAARHPRHSPRGLTRGLLPPPQPLLPLSPPQLPLPLPAVHGARTPPLSAERLAAVTASPPCGAASPPYSPDRPVGNVALQRKKHCARYEY
jgi:hypothetical protein